MIQRLAKAKVNLALHVIGQRGDGYHRIDTLAGFADVGDRLTFERSTNSEISLNLAGPFAGDLTQQGNIVLKAAGLLAEAADSKAGAAITLEKNLPVASGIGGGSADAAATLDGLRDLWELADQFPLKTLAAKLGADVAMCLVSAPLRATGIGEIVEPLHRARTFNALLVRYSPRLPARLIRRLANCRKIRSIQSSSPACATISKRRPECCCRQSARYWQPSPIRKAACWRA
jgi:4-diphosphocytidyl-2-C-methyl-D-erythritol kinase